MSETASAPVRAFSKGYARALRDAAALIRAATEVKLTILPLAHNGEVVVRHINEEWAAKVEGLGG